MALPAARAGEARSAPAAHEASTSSEARREARRAIPLARVAEAHRPRVAKILADPSVFRRMPTCVVDCRPEMFTYLAQNPDVLTEVWRELGLSRVELTRTGPGSYRLEDHAGTTGNLVVVEQQCDDAAQNRIVMLAEGSYDGKPFNKPVAAQCVILLRSGSVRETNGRYYVAVRMDSFVKLDRSSMELLAQALHPFVGKTADRNFSDTIAFVSNLSFTAESRPESIALLAQDLAAIDQPRRDALAATARKCALEGAVWQTSRRQQTAVEAVDR